MWPMPLNSEGRKEGTGPVGSTPTQSTRVPLVDSGTQAKTNGADTGQRLEKLSRREPATVSLAARPPTRDTNERGGPARSWHHFSARLVGYRLWWRGRLAAGKDSGRLCVSLWRDHLGR